MQCVLPLWIYVTDPDSLPQIIRNSWFTCLFAKWLKGFVEQNNDIGGHKHTGARVRVQVTHVFLDLGVSETESKIPEAGHSESTRTRVLRPWALLRKSGVWPALLTSSPSAQVIRSHGLELRCLLQTITSNTLPNTAHYFVSETSSFFLNFPNPHRQVPRPETDVLHKKMSKSSSLTKTVPLASLPRTSPCRAESFTFSEYFTACRISSSLSSLRG